MSSLEETPGPEMGVSDKGDIQNVQCWGAPRTRVEKHCSKGSFTKNAFFHSVVLLILFFFSRDLLFPIPLPTSHVFQSILCEWPLNVLLTKVEKMTDKLVILPENNAVCVKTLFFWAILFMNVLYHSGLPTPCLCLRSAYFLWPCVWFGGGTLGWNGDDIL